MKKILTLFTISLLCACNNDVKKENKAAEVSKNLPTASFSGGHYEGAFTNGMKETFISFDISKDGSSLENLTFKGYWRCGGTLEQTTLGPEKSFEIKGNKVDGHITEPENGGATAIRYQLKANIDGDRAEGSFRMNINALSCDTYLLDWTAEKK